MAIFPDEQADQQGLLDKIYEQQWQAHLAHEVRTRQELKERQQQEETQLYLNEINLVEREMLAAQHQEERIALAKQHRASRIALRKGQSQA